MRDASQFPSRLRPTAQITGQCPDRGIIPSHGDWNLATKKLAQPIEQPNGLGRIQPEMAEWLVDRDSFLTDVQCPGKLPNQPLLNRRQDWLIRYGGFLKRTIIHAQDNRVETVNLKKYASTVWMPFCLSNST